MQVGEVKSGERTSTTPTATAPVPAPVNAPPVATCPKKVVDIEDTLESIAQIEKENKRKNKTKVGPEKPRKKIRTISLAKKRGDECFTDIHMLSKNEPGICTLHVGSTVVKPEAEKRIEELELEAKTI